MTQGNQHTKHGAHSNGRHAVARKSTEAKTALGIVGILLLLVAVGCISFVLYSHWQLDQAQKRLEQTGTPTLVTPAAASDPSTKVDNPVDFATLKTENPDIYAWIYIPDTNINYPILQSVVDDNYYLTRNIDGVVSFEGALYTQQCNSTDFSDPVTVVYGHNIYSPEMMFHQLHLYEDKTYFESHDTFYVYTPGHIFTYKIVAAYEYDNRHIMNTFDFSKDTVVDSYFESVMNPQSIVSCIREGERLDSGDKIVQLSTCVTSGADNSRYIVTGKLINDQLTK